VKPEDAEEFTQAIGQIASGTYRQVALGVRLGVPKALGLDTPTWVHERLGGYVRLGIEERGEVVAELTADGMSTREVADVIGVDHSTVAADLKAVGNPTRDATDSHTAVGNPTPEERYPELASVPAEHRDVIAAELDAMPDEERPAARASLETADVVYSTNEREAILTDLPEPRVRRDLHERAARLIPKHREVIVERIERIEQKLQKIKGEVAR
jgi:IS30 family transposase